MNDSTLLITGIHGLDGQYLFKIPDSRKWRTSLYHFRKP
jgi:hypothetical protein